MSVTHWLLVALVVLVLFGGSKLGDIGKGLGEGIKNFKKGIKDDDTSPPPQLPKKVDDDPDHVEPNKPA